VCLLGTITEVLEGMKSQSTMILGSLPAYVFDKGPWPSSMEHSYILPSETIHICLSLWRSLSRDLVTVQIRPPWPPPIQLEMQSTSVQLRPTPWPSFGCDIVVQLAQALSYSWQMVEFAKLHYDDKRLLHIGPEPSLIHVDIAITLELYWLVLTYYHEQVQFGFIQLLQDDILAEIECYWLHGKGLRAGLFNWSPWNFQCIVAFFVHFITNRWTLLQLGKRGAVAPSGHMRSLAFRLGDELMVSVTTRKFLF